MSHGDRDRNKRKRLVSNLYIVPFDFQRSTSTFNPFSILENKLCHHHIHQIKVQHTNPDPHVQTSIKTIETKETNHLTLNPLHGIPKDQRNLQPMMVTVKRKPTRLK